MRARLLATAVAAGLVLFGPPQTTLANLLINGDFEAGNTGFSSGYIYSPGSIYNPRTYDVVRDPHDSHVNAGSFADHTSGSGFMLAANGATVPDQIVWSESVPVMLGTIYEFSGWGASWGNDGTGSDPAPAAFHIIINGVELAPSISLSPVNGAWQRFSLLWDSMGASNASIQLRLDTTAYVGNDPAFDDFGFAAVPEPTTLALLGLGLAGLAATRRRKP